MENETQTQQQLQRHEEQILQQAQDDDEQDVQSEDMKTVSTEILSDEGCLTEADSANYMCVQEEEYEQESIASVADASSQQLECTQQKAQQYAHQRSHNQAHRQYNPKKSVSFKTLVDIFQLSDAWQLHVKKSSLKTEEDQAKRRILQRNY